MRYPIVSRESVGENRQNARKGLIFGTKRGIIGAKGAKSVFYETEKPVIRLLGAYRVSYPAERVTAAGRDYDALSYRMTGNTEIILPEGTKELSGGCAAYFPAGVDYRRVTAAAEDLIVLHFEPLGGEKSGIEVIRDGEWMRPIFETVLADWQSGGKAGYARAVSGVYRLFAALCERRDETRLSQVLAAGVRSLEAHFREPSFSAAAMAAASHVSETYFRRVYRARFGTSPGAALIEKRFGYARELLASGYYSVKEAAAMAGFADVKYFRTAFAKRYGMTVGAFRRENCPPEGRAGMTDKTGKLPDQPK